MNISIIMPVYNGEKYLADAIESILSQTFSDFEFIIIDDGSSDRTSEIIKKYRNNDTRIKVITLPKNGGLTAALNLAISESKGGFIVRQDADDTSEPERLQEQYEFLKSNPAIDLCSTYAWISGEDGVPIYSFTYPTDDNEIKDFLIRGINPIVHGAVMFRRDILKKVELPVYRFKFGQDFDLWLRISQFANFAIIPKQLYRYRRGESSISHKNTKIKKELKQAVMEMYKNGNGEKWKEIEDEVFAKFADSAAGTKKPHRSGIKSYTSGYLLLLQGKQLEALSQFMRISQIRTIPLICLCLIPFVGWQLARKIHLKMSHYRDITYS